jgi:hypothetical protein
LTKVKVGDSFLLYPPINIGSKLRETLYNNPILNITIICNTLSEENGSQYLTFKIAINSSIIKAHGGATFLLSSHKICATSLTTIDENTLLFTVFKPDSSSEITLEFYIAPLSIGSELF